MQFIPSMFLSLILLLISLLPANSQNRSDGPIIKGFGQVFSVPAPDFVTDPDFHYKVVFDIAVGEEDPAKLNARINTLARFLNMHAQAGVPSENLSVACVFHGTAAKDVMLSELYQERYGVDNPNEPLLKALAAAGVDMYLCGQSAFARNIPLDKKTEAVDLALSAMTVLIKLQAEGYQLIRF